MTGQTISVPVEWALHGKTTGTGSEGYRILASSDGNLSRRNFEDVHARFTPGTPQTLPQVSLSYLTRTDHPDGNYLTLAIHEQAAGNGGDHADHVGREIMFTRYYCVPYPKLRADAITYRAMYEAFRTISLPAPDGRTLTVGLAAAPPSVPPGDELVRTVAALLLTAPVCVLGAEHATTDERLAFIDAVMTLLPYGMRARMAATTWTRAIHRAHRFRLFFSDAPRTTTEVKDHVVVWGRPDQTITSPEAQSSQYSTDYLAWLDDRIHQPARRLAEVTEESGFSRKQVLQMLERIGVARGDSILDYASDGQDLLHSAAPPIRGNPGYCERTLLECAGHVSSQNWAGLKSGLAGLQSFMKGSSPDEDTRDRCKDIICRGSLLRPGITGGKLDDKLYDTLLRLAFGAPVSYPGYCQLEDCLVTGAQPAAPPHTALLEAVAKAGFDDLIAETVVRSYLARSDQKELDKWLRSASGPVEMLIEFIASPWMRHDHARLLCEVALRFLESQRPRGDYDPGSVRTALRRFGYLAQALSLHYPDDLGRQSHLLAGFLAAGFPGGLAANAVADVMTHAASPAPPALLTAVLLLLRDPGDAALLRDLYFDGLCTSPGLPPGIRQRLRPHARPGGGHAGGTLAIEPGRHPGNAPPLPPTAHSMANADTIVIPPRGCQEPQPDRDEKHVGQTWRGRWGGAADLGPR